MATKTSEVKSTGENLRQRFERLGLNIDSVKGSINAIKESKGSEGGFWFTYELNVITPANKFESFICKTYTGTANEQHVKDTKEFFDKFAKGDYRLDNVELRIKGESFGEGKNTGIYESSYINVPFVSNINPIGVGAILELKKQEVEFAQAERATEMKAFIGEL